MKHICRLLLVLLALLDVIPGLAQPPPPPMLVRRLPAGTKSYRNQAYTAAGIERQALDLYLPAQGVKLPVIIWIHDGGFAGGSKDTAPTSRFLTNGYAVASINYRYCTQARFPAQLEDCKAAVRWLRANAVKYNLDPDRFGVYAQSSGALLASLLGTTGEVKKFDKGENLNCSSKVQAVCDFYGPTDLTRIWKFTSEDQPRNSTNDYPEALLIGGRLQDNPAKAAQASPITYVTANAAPFLILHGDQDTVVPYEQSVEFAAALEKAHVPVTFHTVKDGGHNRLGNDRAVIEKLVNEFLAKYLKAPKPDKKP